MADQIFFALLERATAGALPLRDLVEGASALSGVGRRKEAAQLYKIWLSFNPEHPLRHVASFNCGALLNEVGDPVGAAEAYRAAIAHSPDFMPPYINLGGVLERLGDPAQGIDQWLQVADRSTTVSGSSVTHVTTALKQIARVLMDLQDQAQAETALRRCIEIAPDQREAVEQYVALRMTQCEWPVMTPLETVSHETLMRAVSPLSMDAFTDDPMLQFASAWRYVLQTVPERQLDPALDRRNAPIDLQSRRLRVGYVSSDLRDHAIGYLMAELLELHDRNTVEVFAYYCGPEPEGALNARIRAAVEHWVDIRLLSDDDAARQIAADGIDILVDVNGLTKDARTAVFARRPAPIQVNWLGYPGSMGTPYHHYIVADPWIIPPESEIYYSERVVRLGCYQSNDRKRVVAAQRPTRADVGLPEDATVFCCFNGVHKISRFTFARWMEILSRTPGSVLWLLDGGAATTARLRALAEQAGVAPDRLVFAPKQANPAHLARYPLADLFLDTAPYGAHTTASDALWMGMPVLTLSGRSFASRVCGSLVRAAGVPELVCETARDYVERAVALGHDRAALQAFRARLEAGRDTCLLFDMDRLARDLEGLYRAMAEDYTQNGAPKPDLANLDIYLELGAAGDHEAQEMQALDDYLAFYKARLAKRHRARPIPPDGRLWTPADVAAAG